MVAHDRAEVILPAGEVFIQFQVLLSADSEEPHLCSGWFVEVS